MREDQQMKPMVYVPDVLRKKINLGKTFKAVTAAFMALGWRPDMISDYGLSTRLKHNDHTVDLFVVKNAENVVHITSAPPKRKAKDGELADHKGRKVEVVRTKLTDIVEGVKHVVCIQLDGEVKGFLPLMVDQLQNLENPALYLYSEIMNGVRELAEDSLKELLTSQIAALRPPSAPSGQIRQPDQEDSPGERKNALPSPPSPR